MSDEVPALRTPATLDEVQDAFFNAWVQRFGVEPTDDVLALLLALSHFETGNWKSMYWDNPGMIVLGDREAPYFRLRDKQTGDFTAHRYMAYQSLGEGTSDMVRQLTRPEREQWHRGLVSGDPIYFARSLSGLEGGPSYHETAPALYEERLLGRWRPIAARFGIGFPVASPKAQAPHSGQSSRCSSDSARPPWGLRYRGRAATDE